MLYFFDGNVSEIEVGLFFVHSLISDIILRTIVCFVVCVIKDTIPKSIHLYQVWYIYMVPLSLFLFSVFLCAEYRRE